MAVSMAARVGRPADPAMLCMRSRRARGMMKPGRGLEVSRSWLSPAWRPGPGASGSEPPLGDRTQERRIDWFELAGGEYRPLPSGDDGAVESRLFPGLRIAVPALLAGNPAAALDAVNRSIDSPEHCRFVARLATRRSGGDIP